MTIPFLLYGSTGYTGNLIAHLAVKRGLRPILAGRNAKKLQQQGVALGLPYRVAALDDRPALDRAVADIPVVLNCAGPFLHTASPVLASCLRMRAHYLDLTGEIPVFETLAARDAEIQTAGIMALPGVGFDVVPTDCLAAYLKQQLPSATYLSLILELGQQFSRGTALTAIEQLPQGAAIRRCGELRRIEIGEKCRKLQIDGKTVYGVAIPWGDIATAYRTTGIPNIDVFVALPLIQFLVLPLIRAGVRLMGVPLVQQRLIRLFQRWDRAPRAPMSGEGQSRVWGEVQDNDHQLWRARLDGPAPYILTALAALAIVERVLAGQVAPGFQTPARAYGADLIFDIPGVVRQDMIVTD